MFIEIKIYCWYFSFFLKYKQIFFLIQKVWFSLQLLQIIMNQGSLEFECFLNIFLPTNFQEWKVCFFIRINRLTLPLERWLLLFWRFEKFLSLKTSVSNFLIVLKIIWIIYLSCGVNSDFILLSIQLHFFNINFFLGWSVDFGVTDDY